jgi:hypothetical protein
MSIAPKRGRSFGRRPNGFKVLLDLNKHDKSETVQALEAIIAPLKGWWIRFNHRKHYFTLVD